MDSHFWYEPAYRALFDALPTDHTPVWVEVGVLEGDAIKWLCAEATKHGRPLAIHAVDDFRGWEGTLRGAALEDAFIQHVAPALTESVTLILYPRSSISGAGDLYDDSCDVVWLDADHSYEAVKADIAAWWPKVRPGGALGGDDWAFGDRGVERAVTEAFPTERIHLINGEREGQVWPSWIVRKPITPTDP